MQLCQRFAGLRAIHTHTTSQSRHSASLQNYAHHLAPPSSVIADIPTSAKYDAIIVGGGHNGLVSAAYLAKRGLSVAVLERRPMLGGAAVTEQIHPGFHYSRASYLFSLFRPHIVSDLSLKKHGLKFHFRDPSSFTPLLDGRSLTMGPSMEFNQSQIAKFSQRDARQYAEYEHHLSSLTKCFEPLLDLPSLGATSNLTEKINQYKKLLALLKNSREIGLSGLQSLHEIMTAPATKILDRWFDSEPLKSTLATDAVIGAMIAPSMAGSGYVLFHHVMGEVDGQQGAWAYVEGGMGAVSNAIAGAAREAGAQLFTNAPVSRINVSADTHSVTGITLTNGQTINANIVLSNVSPIFTYMSLIDRALLDTDFIRSIESVDTTSPVTKLNLSIDRLPQFRAVDRYDSDGGPEHRGTIHFVENCQQIEQAYNDAKAGTVSDRPVIEMTIPSVFDRTLAPSGKHVVSLFTQYTPYHPINGSWSDPQFRDAYAAKVFSVIEEYCPGFRSSILHYELLAPPDLEAEFGLSGGNIFHTAMGLDQLFWLRPASRQSSCRSPVVKGLYLCGAGTHPGGGVMGAPGKNAADTVCWDLKR